MSQVEFPVFVDVARPPVAKPSNVRTNGKLVQKPVVYAMRRVKVDAPVRTPSFLRQCEIVRTVGLFAFAREAGLGHTTVAKYVAGCAIHRSTERTIIQTAVRLNSVTP